MRIRNKYDFYGLALVYNLITNTLEAAPHARTSQYFKTFLFAFPLPNWHSVVLAVHNGSKFLSGGFAWKYNDQIIRLIYVIYLEIDLMLHQ